MATALNAWGWGIREGLSCVELPHRHNHGCEAHSERVADSHCDDEYDDDGGDNDGGDNDNKRKGGAAVGRGEHAKGSRDNLGATGAEIRLVQRLKHRNIVRYLGVAYDDTATQRNGPYRIATGIACGACFNACCQAGTGGASGEESGVVIVDNRHRTLAVGLDGTHTPTRLERLEKSANATLAVSTAAMQTGATSPRGISAMSKIPDSPLQESELQFLQPNTTEAQRGPYHDTIRMVPGSTSSSREIELRYRCATSENAATLKVPSKPQSSHRSPQRSHK